MAILPECTNFHECCTMYSDWFFRLAFRYLKIISEAVDIIVVAFAKICISAAYDLHAGS